MYNQNTAKYNILSLLIPAVLVIVAFVLWSPQADASIVVEGDREFMDEVNNCFNTYRNAEGVVGDVIRELENSEHEHKIINSPDWNNTTNNYDEAEGGAGSGTVTRVDKEKLEEYVERIESLKHKDFCTALLHELWHAIDADRGTWSPHTETIDGVKRNEVEATLFQNFIHAIRGVPPRTHYGNVDISKHVVIGDEPTEEEQEEETSEEDEKDVEVTVLIIGGLHYPAEQFTAALPDACESEHYHSAFGGPVYALEGGSITDPAPQACGFGTVVEVEHATIQVEASVYNSYMERAQ